MIGDDPISWIGERDVLTNYIDDDDDNDDDIIATLEWQ
jgi:hypothetical protein